MEYTYKTEQIKKMKGEIAESIRDMRYKEELKGFLEDEYKKIPKGNLSIYIYIRIDVKREFYMGRIQEFVNSVKGQKKNIDSSINDIRELKESINRTIDIIQRQDNELEDLLFKDAKKDKIAKEIYKALLDLRDVSDYLYIYIYIYIYILCRNIQNL